MAAVDYVPGLFQKTVVEILEHINPDLDRCAANPADQVVVFAGSRLVYQPAIADVRDQ